MFSFLKVACIGTLISLALLQTGPALSQTDDAQLASLIQGIQSNVVKTIAAQDNTVEITLAKSVLTVLRVNSNQNGSTHAGRNNEAASIAATASRAMSADAVGGAVHTIRVQYLTRDSAHPEGDVIDTVEFRKNPQGVFDIHIS